MCRVIGIITSFQYKCITISKFITMSNLTNNIVGCSHLPPSGSVLHHRKKQGSGAEFLQLYVTLKLWVSGLTLGLAEMQLFDHEPQFPMIFSKSLSQLVSSCQERPGVLCSATMPAQMQKQSLLSPVVARVSKVQATRRAFFTRKLFGRPKYDEMSAEKPCLWWQRVSHVESCCCACGVPAAAEPEHLSAFSSRDLSLTNHTETS